MSFGSYISRDALSDGNHVNLGGYSPGRIYVTSHNMGIDLSVDSVQAEFTPHYEDRLLEIDGRISPSFRYGQGFELRLKFTMPSLNVLYPTRKSYDRGRVHELDPDGRIYLLDHGKPIPPRLPIWLPPGFWRCCHCDCMQNEGLLQCRSCGATRFEALDR
jgi:hypothetical protein